MVKKIFVGVLLAGMFGLLVFGAVNRTLAKADDNINQLSEKSLDNSNSSNNGSGNNGMGNNGSGTNSSAATPLNKNLNKNESRADGLGSQAGSDCDTRAGKNATSNETSSGNVNERGQGNGQSESAPIGLAEVDAWITQTGTVESVDDELLVVNLTDGTTLEIEGRTLSYALELGLSVNVGDELVLTGFMEEDQFEVGQIENITTGQIVVVRAENGRPLWAGGWH